MSFPTKEERELMRVAEAAQMAAYCDDVMRIAALDADLAHTKVERDDLQASFDLRWNADMRAIERWRGNDPAKSLTMPDHADLCVWLLEQLEAERQRAERLQANCVSWAERSEMGWRGLQNIYSVIEGRECDQAVALGMATSSVVRLKERAEKVATASCGHYWLKEEWSGCPVCAMKEGLAIRIGDLMKRAEKAEAASAAREVNHRMLIARLEDQIEQIATLTAERDEMNQLIGEFEDKYREIMSSPLHQKNDEQEIELTAARWQRDQALLERDGMEASCAAMQEALEWIRRTSTGVPNQLGCDSRGNCSMRDCDCSNHTARRILDSTTAGADLLERLRVAEAALSAATGSRTRVAASEPTTAPRLNKRRNAANRPDLPQRGLLWRRP